MLFYSKEVWKVDWLETDYPRLDAIKHEFDQIYENEKKKKEFDKYYVLNKYAKQKKRKRNFSIDRSHHYDIILDEDVEKKGSGYLKPFLLVLFLSFGVFIAMQVKLKMSDQSLSFSGSTPNAKEDDPSNPKTQKKNKKNKWNKLIHTGHYEFV